MELLAWELHNEDKMVGKACKQALNELKKKKQKYRTYE